MISSETDLLVSHDKKHISSQYRISKIEKRIKRYLMHPNETYINFKALSLATIAFVALAMGFISISKSTPEVIDRNIYTRKKQGNDGMLVSESKKLIYHLNPKCGTQTMRKWMMHEEFDFGFNARFINGTQIEERHENFTHFTTIREPMSRFISAYNHIIRKGKLRDKYFLEKSLGQVIDIFYEENFTNPRNHHLELQSVNLNRMFKLDFLVRVESLKDDLAKRGINYPMKKKWNVNTEKKASKNGLSESQIEKLCWILEPDYIALKQVYDIPLLCKDAFSNGKAHNFEKIPLVTFEDGKMWIDQIES